MKIALMRMLFLLVGILSIALVACSKKEAPVEPVRAVKLLTVRSTEVTAQQEYAGEVRARIESRLGFRVGGKLVARLAELGQPVQAGQLLAQLDVTDLTLGSQAAQAQVSAAQTQRDLAAADLKRFADLRAQGFISTAELDRRQAALDTAEAGLRQAKAQAAVQGNQAGYARLQADAAGVVVGVEAEVGQVVAAGAPVVRIARNGARDVVFGLPEDRLDSVKLGTQAQVRLWSTARGGRPLDESLPGTVREVSASADPLTRTYFVKIALPSDANAALGSTAYVTLAASAKQTAVALPTSALMRASDNGTAVWVFDPATSTVRRRTVQLAGADGNAMLVASGLNSGEQVVVAGAHVLVEGQKVTRFVARPANN